MERIYSVDFLKGIAIVIVVFFHTMSHKAELHGEFGSLLLYAFPRFVIPFFFIASGYFFGMKLKRVYFSPLILKAI
ncbi:acyltransferase family protein [Bacillus sp. FJAT-49732]|uniref:Acyltransferase family protein n=1 Tax=Lederbergia citrisecunda TaxID=2833583 RepID=A0A942TJ11_9BACI|nr:acyltransferase family protein [Lederbergia citrisecunda]MBS4198428.1 acyltransferase family protein [Lederbergia citrisecunda]